METMVSGSDEPELKHRNLVMQWKHLLDHIDLLQTQFEELQERLDSERNSLQTRQREVEEREEALGAKVLNFHLEMESKAQELYENERMKKEKRREVGGKEKWLLEIEELVRGKERERDLIKKMILKSKDVYKRQDDTVMLIGIICQNKPVLQLCQILSFADKIPGFVCNLIERKQLIKAVRLICTFKLTDVFSPVVLLNKYVEDVRKSFRAMSQGRKTIYEKDNAINNLIAELRGAIQCIKDHNLESEYPSKDIELEIVQLQSIKENLRRLPVAIASRCEQQERERGKRCSTSSAPRSQPPEKRQNRSHLAAVAATRSYTTFRSQLNPSPQLFRNSGLPGQFSMAANHRETGGSFGSTQSTSPSELYENYGHPLQFAMDHEIGANFRRMQFSSSSQPAENFGFPPLASNAHEIGGNFSAMQDAGLYNSNQFFPGTRRSGPSET